MYLILNNQNVFQRYVPYILHNCIFFFVQGPIGPTGPKGELGFPGRPVCIVLTSGIKTEELAPDTYCTISTYFRDAQD